MGVAVAARIPFGPEPPPEFDPLRMREIESHHIETDADGLVRSGALDVLCRLNVPQDDKEETFEEISLEGETRGGGWGERRRADWVPSCRLSASRTTRTNSLAPLHPHRPAQTVRTQWSPLPSIQVSTTTR